MQTHDESNDPKDQAAESSEHGDQREGLPAGGIGSKDPENVPDGSGTDAQGSDSDQGQENGGQSFDAG